MKLDSRSLIKSQDSAVSCLSENTDYSALSPNKAATSQSPHCSVTPETSDSVLLFSALEVFKDLPGMASRSTKCLKITENTPQPTKRKGDEITLPNKRLCISPDTDDSVELVVNTNGSITPDGLVPPVVESPNKLQASGGLKDCSPVKNITMRKKKAQRLESSSESSESSEEELPSLAQIFKSRRPHAVQCNLVEGTDETPKGLERLSGCEEPSLLARPLANPPVCPPSPDFVESSQASVDLFDTPAECDIAAIDTGFSMDSSPFSNDLLVTQQKLAMQQELLRLGDLIGLVTEVLHDKEEGTTTEQDLQSTGHGLPMPCAQEVKQTAEGDPAPITRRDSISLNSSAANHVESTPPCSLKPGNATETVPQSSTATRHSARLSGDPGTPSTPGSKVKTKPPLPPSPETRETTTGAQVTTRRRMSAVAHATTRKPECVLVSSGLGSSEQVMVKKFAKRIGARVAPQVTSEVTHVIMCTDENLVCERTLKYFLGIAGRKWVVSFLWISECLKQGELLDESVFEVRGDVVNGVVHQGPMRARTAGDQDLLMKGYEIGFQGSFPDMTSDQMEWMVELCGAIVVKDPLQLNSEKCSHQLLIVQPGTETSLAEPSALSRRATVVTRSWLLDSVATYTLQNHSNYRA